MKHQTIGELWNLNNHDDFSDTFVSNSTRFRVSSSLISIPLLPISSEEYSQENRILESFRYYFFYKYLLLVVLRFAETPFLQTTLNVILEYWMSGAHQEASLARETAQVVRSSHYECGMEKIPDYGHLQYPGAIGVEECDAILLVKTKWLWSCRISRYSSGYINI